MAEIGGQRGNRPSDQDSGCVVESKENAHCGKITCNFYCIALTPASEGLIYENLRFVHI